MIKPKESILNMSGYFVPLFEKEWDIKIDSNENNYGPSPKVIEALKRCDYKSISFYPFYGELSRRIADYQGVSIDNIKVTNGADEAICSIIQTYLDKDDALLTLDVSFDMPVIYSQIQGGNVIKVPYKNKWEFPLNDFISEISNPKVKIIYIATPNNPTGNIIDEKSLISILNNSDDKVVLIDETYANYAGMSYKKFINEYNNVFIVRSFSKDFALAGLRLGYVISNSENINYLKKVVSPFSVNSFALQAGIAALSDIDYLEFVKKEINSSKIKLKEYFETLGAVVYNSYANFLLVDFGKKAEFVYNKLKTANISVKLFKKETLLENHLRVTIPTKIGLERIKDVLKVKPSLVFDMDGVLINAGNSYRLAIEKTYEHFSGETVSSKTVQDAKNLGGLNNDWDLTKFLLDKKGINVSYGDIVDTFQKIYWNDGKGVINNEEPLFNKSDFQKLSEKYNLSIFTGRLKKEAMYALEKIGAVDVFYPIITTDDIPEGMGKPNSFGLNLIQDMTISGNYYYFGDTPDDIIAAKSAGYIPVGVLPPQDKSNELSDIMKSKGAKIVINSVNEINKILEISNETVY